CLWFFLPFHALVVIPVSDQPQRLQNLPVLSRIRAHSTLPPQALAAVQLRYKDQGSLRGHALQAGMIDDDFRCADGEDQSIEIAEELQRWPQILIKIEHWRKPEIIAACSCDAFGAAR